MACVAIVDYKAGNNRSVAKAFEAVGGEPIITDKKEDLCKADRIVLPGVGAFGDGMLNLQRLGLLETLGDEVLCRKIGAFPRSVYCGKRICRCGLKHFSFH